MLRSAAAAALTLRGRRREGVPLRLVGNVKKAFPYLVSDLLGLIYFRGDILVLTAFVTAAQVGEYVSATGLINPAVQVASAMSVGALAYAAPQAFAGDRDTSDPTTIYRFFRQAGLGAAGLISLGLPIAILVLFGGSGTTILQLALILTLFLSLRFANFGLSAILLAQGGAPRRVLVLLASIAVSVSFNLLLVRFLGAFGSAWSALLTEFVVAAALLWASRIKALIRPVATALASTAVLALVTMAGLKMLDPRPAAVVVGLCYLAAAARFLIQRRRVTRTATAIPVHTEEVV
jgi:O-antigen/teichoic acid export membrane protein